jgi:hypothetical protein
MWQTVDMNRPPVLRCLVALILLALLAMPFGGAMAMGGGVPDAGQMAGMSMDGMSTDSSGGDMDCCPPEKPDPSSTCDKSACPTMATCMQQCVPASAAAELRVISDHVRQDEGMPEPDDLLTSLGPEPPPRPPKT